MSAPRPPTPVKLICGIIAAGEAWLPVVTAKLVEAFGVIDLTSERVPFDGTDYYEAEMGPDLVRQFVSFASLVDPAELPAIKRKTNVMELDLAADSAPPVCRPVNLDPGYVTAAKLVLATAKDFAHRIYICDGIYAEVTLRFGKDGCRFSDWTYPDLRSGVYTPFLLAVRERLMAEQQSDSTRRCP